MRRAGPVSYTLLIAVCAVLIAGFSAYYSHFYPRPQLDVVIVPEPTDQISVIQDSPFNFTPVLANRGREAAVVLSVQLSLKGTIQIDGNPAGPFVVRGGDAISTAVQYDITPDLKKFIGHEAEVTLNVVALASNRTVVRQSIPLGQVTFPPDGSPGFEWRKSPRYGGPVVALFP